MSNSFPIYRADRYLHDRSSFSGPVEPNLAVYSFTPIPRREDRAAGTNLLVSETIPDGTEPAFLIVAPDGARLIEMTDGSTALEAMGPLGIHPFTAALALSEAREGRHGFSIAEPA